MENLMEALYLAMEEDGDVRDGDFQGETLAGIETRNLSFVRCKFQNVTFGENESPTCPLWIVNCAIATCRACGWWTALCTGRISSAAAPPACSWTTAPSETCVLMIVSWTISP